LRHYKGTVFTHTGCIIPVISCKIKEVGHKVPKAKNMCHCADFETGQEYSELKDHVTCREYAVDSG